MDEECEHAYRAGNRLMHPRFVTDIDIGDDFDVAFAQQCVGLWSASPDLWLTKRTNGV